MKYRYIAIEGNIGSGKSTLANLLAEHYNARLVAEEFTDNTFLPKFYNDPVRYAFPLELSFVADRYKQLKSLLINQDIFQQTIVSDYLFIKSKLFARINLKDDEYELFQKLFDIIDVQLPRPDLLIYLHTPINKLKQHIHARGRSYEQDITAEYLENIQDVYRQYLKREIHKTLVIETANADFAANPAHFQQVVDFLEKDYDFSTYRLSIS